MTTAESKDFKLYFFDVAGRIVNIPYNHAGNTENKQVFIIQNNGLKAGLYYVKIMSANEIIAIGKFIVN
ncbi:MAG: T9SS type A sorting domain-containing protein [Bacteroidia bacterium]|nr:T9SS type A sorting domain-containing protein [Bacteroidia bacterium]